jgi:uncharacterized membrane-anchored protein
MDRRLRFAAVIAVQLLILAAVPWRQVLARLRGQTVTLLTAPVDPFSPFGGYFMTLAYEVERDARDGSVTACSGRDRVYFVVEKAAPAWRLVSVERELPRATPGRAALRAPCPPREREWRRAELESAGRFYLPEAKAKVLEEAMAAEWKRVRELPDDERERAQRTRMLVDLRADDEGNVALLRLRFGDLTFEE